MRQLIVAFAIVTIAACAGDEASRSADDAASKAAKEAADEAAAPAEAAEEAAAPAEAGEEAPVQAVPVLDPAEAGEEAAAPEEAAAAPAKDCLDLVGKSEFKQAVPVCMKALENDPDNHEVQEALLKAQSGIAGEAATGAAKGAAEGAMGDPVKGLPGN